MHKLISFANELLKLSLKIVNKSQAKLYQKNLDYIAIAEAYHKIGQPENAASVVKILLELNRKHKNNDYLRLE